MKPSLTYSVKLAQTESESFCNEGLHLVTKHVQGFIVFANNKNTFQAVCKHKSLMIKNQSLNSFDYCLSCRIQITKTIRKQGELSYSCEILVFQGFYCLLLYCLQKIDNIQSGASQSTFRGCYNSDIFTKNVGSPAPVPANTCTPINGKSHNTRQGVSLASFQPCHVCYVVIIF